MADQLDTAAIRAKLAALKGFTEGPWRFSPWRIEEGNSAVYAPDGWLICTTSSDANADLIAAAPDMRATIPTLCDEVDRLRAENERLREAAEYFATWDQCWPGNINLEVACKKIRAALAQKEGE